MAASEDHEARVAALEASQPNYRAVPAAVNALGADQREHPLQGRGEACRDDPQGENDAARPTP